MASKTRRLGEFVIRRELGRGGMGVVFEAYQASLGRSVAVKVLPSHISLNAGALDRFRREAMTAGRLTHPGIAKVYSVGQEEDLHYFAMELVKGPSLEHCLDEVRGKDPASLRQNLVAEAGYEEGTWVPASPHLPYFAAAAAWIAEVAEALAYAHDENVIHRDVKPSNLLIRRNGSPVLVDFGLAQDQSATAITQTGDAIGTPAYMAPEQARGQRDVDARVDVYGLGATLYELVTLRPPFIGKHPTAVMRSILDDDVVDPCRINRSCPRELANVILKALEKDREDRYSSVRAFAADLRSFLRGDTVLAQAPTTSQKIKRALRRRRKSLLASAITTAVLVVGTLGVVAITDSRERDSGQTSLDKSIRQLVQGNDVQALNLFFEARKQLGDERVKRPWLAALARRAELLIEGGDEERVQRLVDSCAAPYRDDPEVVAWMDRARGLGTLGFVLDPPDARLTMHRLSKHGATELPNAGPERQELPIGRYSVEASAGDEHEPARVVVDLRRGENLVVHLRALPRSMLRDGCAYVAGDLRAGIPPFLIDRREVTVAEFDKFLRTLPRDVRAALTPELDWNGEQPFDDRRDWPVRGVRAEAAVAYARWSGGHLPLPDEFALAGHLGAGWRYPWGAKFDATKLVADPLREAGPQKPGSRATGASRNGCVDLCGNVSEWVCDESGRFWAAGGSFESEEREIGLDKLATRDPLRGHRDVGFRVAYYLPGTTNKSAVTRDNWQKLSDSGRLQLRSTFAIEKEPTYSVELRGNLIGMKSLPTQLELPGGFATFHSVGERIDALKALGLTLNRTDRWTRKYAADFARVVREAEGRFEARVESDVVPRQALVSLGAGRFAHRFVVLDQPGAARFHRVQLPPRSRVLSSSVMPSEIDHGVASTVVSYEFLPRASGGARRIPVELRFALDDEGKPLPSSLQLGSWINRFVRTWNRSDVDEIRAFLAKEFAFGPNALRRAELMTLLRRRRAALEHPTHGATARSAWQKLPAGKLSVESIGAAAGLVGATVRLWHRRDGETSSRWSFVWKHGERGLELVDLRAPARVDSSRLEDKRAVHEDLGLRVAQHDRFVLGRASGYPADLQLRLDKRKPTFVQGEGGIQHRVEFRVEVFARELAAEESAEGFARSVLDPAYLLWTALPFRKREHQVHGVPALRRRFYLTREWADAPTITQERVLFERGRTAVLVVATASSESKEANVVAIAWQQLLGKLFDEVLMGVRF